MSIWIVKNNLPGRRQCKRFHRMFHPREEGQEYGPKCARKIAQIPIEERLDTRPYEQEGKKKAPRTAGVCRVCGCTDFTPCPGGCAWVKPDLCSSCASEEELDRWDEESVGAEPDPSGSHREKEVIM